MAADSYVWTGEEGKEERDVLQQLVDNEDVTPQEAVQQVLNLTNAPKSYPNPLAVHCEATAGGLILAAARTPAAKQSKLVAFVHEIRGNTVKDPSTGEPLKHDNSVVWKDLPTFGYTIADELSSIPDSSPTPDKMEKWENTVAFFAQLDASTRDPELDFTHTWALIFISSGLVEKLPHFDIDLIVRLACLWFVYDAEKLWSKVPDAPNFSLAQWQQWKHALGEERNRTQDEKARSMVDAALAEMERVESK